MERKIATIDPFCGVVFLDTPCILVGMKWYERAKTLMKSKKIRQEDLIDVFGVKTRGAIGHYLSGRRDPTPDQLIAFARRLNCSLDELMGNIDPDHAVILAKLKGAKDAMKSLGREFTKEQEMTLYRIALNSGLDEPLTDEQLSAIIESLILKKH